MTRRLGVRLALVLALLASPAGAATVGGLRPIDVALDGESVFPVGPPGRTSTYLHPVSRTRLREIFLRVEPGDLRVDDKPVEGSLKRVIRISIDADPEIRNGIVYRVANGAVERIGEGFRTPGLEPKRFRDAVVEMPARVEAGSTWGPDARLRAVGRADVAVRAGRFEGCLVVEHPGEDGRTVREYFAPGVGRVLVQVQGPEGTWSTGLELERQTLPRDP